MDVLTMRYARDGYEHAFSNLKDVFDATGLALAEARKGPRRSMDVLAADRSPPDPDAPTSGLGAGTVGVAVDDENRGRWLEKVYHLAAASTAWRREAMRTQSTLVVVLVAVITTVGFVPVGSAMGMQDAEPSTGETVQAVEEEPCLVPHPPIHIRGNEDFLSPGSGVIAGAGTEQAPYVIAGWCIDGDDETWDDVDFGADQESGIVIEDTDAHVLIVSNTITNHDQHGVRLKGVENAELRNNTITNNDRYGVRLSGSSDNNVVRDNTITNNVRYGVYLLGSSDNVVRDNTLTDNYVGVYLRSSSDGNVVENNTLTDNDWSGVYLLRSSEDVVRDNTITDNGYFGVYLVGSSDDNVVEANVLQGNTVGIRVEGVFFGDAPTGTIIHDNNIHDNTDAGLHANYLSEPVDATDNWWGHETGPSGGTTDACTSTTADGQGDAITTSNAEVCFAPWRTSPNPDAGAGAD